MKALIAVALIIGVPAITWWFCLKVSELVDPYEHGYVGFISNIPARKHKRSGRVEYKFEGTKEWREAAFYSETFRTTKQHS